MNTIKYPLIVKLALLLILMLTTVLDCGGFTESILVYVSNETKSNFHLKRENGLRVRVGETTDAPVTFLNKKNPSRTFKVCRDQGCIAEITVTGEDFPKSKEGELPFKDTIVVEEPDWEDFTAYSLLDVVTVSIKKL